MKQHITVEQLNELSEKGKEKYSEWYQETYAPFAEGSIYVYEDENGTREYTLPALSIGQMIEFLDAQEYQDIEKIEKSPIDWIVWINDKEFIEIGKDKKRGKQQNELCDALWEAVKEVLEK